MMKHFEWALEHNEDERARLLRVYIEIRRQYDLQPTTDVIRGMINTWLTEPQKKREERKESEKHARTWVAISGLIEHWCKYYDPSRSIRTLINEHQERYTSDPEYIGKIDSGELQTFVFNRSDTDDKSEFWYSNISSCYPILNDEYLLFNNTVWYQINTDLSLNQALDYAISNVEEFLKKVQTLDQYDFVTPLNTMNFAGSIIKHIEDASIGYFPELNELKDFLLPSKMTEKTKAKRGGQRKYTDAQIAYWKEKYYSEYKGKNYTQSAIYEKMKSDFQELKVPFPSFYHFRRFLLEW